MAKLSAKERLRRTAYHEAGHTVVAYGMNVPFQRVTIEPGEDYYGMLVRRRVSDKIRPDVEMNLRTRNYLERSIMVSFGGIVAEELHKRKSLTIKQAGADRDFQNVISCSGYICTPGKEETAFLGWLLYRTQNVLSYPLNWKYVRVLVEALLKEKTIPARRVRTMFKETFQSEFNRDRASVRMKGG
jgi:hypothetical protein